MLSFILFILFAVLLSVWPVMYAARYFGAHRTTFGWCLVAVIATSLIQPGIEQVIYNVWVSFLLGLIANGFLYSVILESSVKTGIKIAFISVLILTIIVFLTALIIS